jgi:hypothetical protein
LTVAYNIRNANLQARIQAKLKAVEVIAAANGPRSATERLKFVRRLLGKDLVIDESLTDEFVAQGLGPGHNESRKDLIRMLLEFPNNREEILRFWAITFGQSSLGKDIERLKTELGF